MRPSAWCLAILMAAAYAVEADSLFTASAERSGTLISEKTARFEIGDIVTVLVREEIDASTTADTNTKKESDVQSEANANENEFLIARNGMNFINKEELPNWNIEVENETKARGKTVRKSILNTTVSCLVTEVFPNGNIRLEGEKTMSVNREDSLLKVSGIVRSRDVTPANTVQSTQMANIQLKLRGKGPLWNNQRRGLITRLLDWFSPF